ncbi:MAG: hypothetical protein JW821_04030 [Deltaproteobacteria bacterium]|nr:hypothetical protein [Deltaproteobacteria bacterium]
MKKGLFCRLFPILLLALAMAPGVGCGTIGKVTSATTSFTRSLYQKVRPSAAADSSGLKKRVFVLPPLNQSDLDGSRVQQIMDDFIARLEKDKGLLVKRMTEAPPSTTKLGSPDFGIVTDPDLAKAAEEEGMHVLITTVFSPFEIVAKKRGIWPFRKVKRDLEASMVVNALDVANGTLFFSHLESGTVRIQEDEEKDLWEDEVTVDEKKLATFDRDVLKRINPKKYNKMWAEIVKDQVSEVRRGLRGHPWSGRILSFDGKTAIVNAGRDVGVSSGKVFEVFERGDPVHSVTGRSFFLVGEKVGEIKTVAVQDRYCSAVPLSGEGIRAGHIVRAKQ